MQPPLVSVLTTSYNREKYIAACIESVLASTLKNFELIIVDDASTDDTVSIAQAFAKKDNRIKVFVNSNNLGDYPNRNKAASYATGKYIKYLDADDMIYPHGLEVMVSAMEKFPEAGFGLAALPEDTRPYPVCIMPKEIYLEHFYGYGHFDRAPGSAIIKRDSFIAVSGFSGERMVGDLELWPRLARQYPMIKFPMDLYWNRLHEGQEFQTEYAKKVYPIRTKQIITDALLHKDCPLSNDEKKKIFARMSKQKKKAYFLKLISKLK